MIQKLKNLKEEMRQYTHNELLAEIDSEKLRVIIQHSNLKSRHFTARFSTVAWGSR